MKLSLTANKNPITDKPLIKLDKRFRRWTKNNIYPLEYLSGKRYILVFEYHKNACSIQEGDTLSEIYKYLYDLGKNTVAYSMTEAKLIHIFDNKNKKEVK